MVTCGIRESRSPGNARKLHVLARKISVRGARRCTEVAHASPGFRSVCNPQWPTYGEETLSSRTAILSKVSRPSRVSEKCSNALQMSVSRRQMARPRLPFSRTRCASLAPSKLPRYRCISLQDQVSTFGRPAKRLKHGSSRSC
jgi:hypothetical protein